MGENCFYYFQIPQYFSTTVAQKTGIVILLLLTVCISTFASINEIYGDEDIHVKQFLHKQFDRAKVEIKRSFMGLRHIQYNRYKRDYSLSLNVSWHKIWESDQGTKEFSHFNETFLIVGKTIMVVRKSEDFVNSLAYLDDDIIIFSKVYEWQHMRLLLLGKKTGESLLFISSFKDNIEFQLVQTIPHPSSKGSYPVDGEFFIHNERLYLFLVYDTQNHVKITSILYKWQSAYFDIEISNIFTERAVGISSFNYGSSVIIVVIQSASGEEQVNKVTSLVLKFSLKEKSKLEKIQFLPMKDPQNTIHFQFFEEDFVFVCEIGSSSTIYWWEGGEFIRWPIFPEVQSCKSIIPGYIANNTLFFIIEHNEIGIYWMTSEGVERVNSITFDGEIIAFSNDASRLITAIKVQESVKVIVINLMVENSQIVVVSDPVELYDPLQECFDDLEKELGRTKEKLFNINRNFSELLFRDRTVVIKGQIQVSDGKSEVAVLKGSVTNLTNDYNSNSLIGLMTADLDKLFNKSSTLLEKLKPANERNLRDYADFIFKEDLYIDTLKMNSAMARLINDYIIEESKLISLSKDQYLESIEVKSISINWLVADHLKTKNINELILNDAKNLEWDQSASTSSLVCYNMVFSYEPLINNINLNDIVHKNNNITTVSGVKITGGIEAKRILIEHINGITFDKWFQENLMPHLDIVKQSRLNLNDNAIINDLKVKYINGIDMNSFLNNIFINGIENTINGNLCFEKGFEAKKLISSFVHYMRENTLSNLSFDVISSNGSGDGDNLQVKRADNSREKFHKPPVHVYKERLFVEGCMQVNEIVFEDCHLIFGNKTVSDVSLASEYWTRSSNQTIPQRVTFSNKVHVEGDLISVNKVNGNNIDDLLTIGHTREINSSLIFKNVLINGNVTSDKDESFSIKEFNDLVLNYELVKNFSGDILQGKSANKNMKYKNHDCSSEPEKIWGDFSLINKKVTVYGNLIVDGNIVANEINEINVSNAHKGLLFNASEAGNFTFSHVKAKSINIKKLNDVPFEEIIHFNSDKAPKKIINRLLVKDNIHLIGINVDVINDLNIHNLFPKVVNSSQNTKLQGKKIFKSTTIIGNNFKVDSVNNFTIQVLLTDYVSKSKPQSITGEFHLRNVSVDSLESPFMNGIDTSSFLNTKSGEEMYIKSDEIIFEKFSVNGDVIVHNILDGCRFPKSHRPLLFDVLPMHWLVMDIKGDSYWKTDKNNKGNLETLFDDAVTLDNGQKITGSVTFLKDVFTDNIHTNKTINGVNMLHLMSDAVLKSKKNQVITGEKLFVKAVNCLYATVLGDALIETVNGKNIAVMNKTLVRRNVDQIISGHKYFKNGFSAVSFITEGFMNGVPTDNMVMVNTEKKLPHVTFKNLEIIENIDFERVNGIRLEEFLTQRVLIKRRKGHEQIVESDIIFNGSVSLMGGSFVQSLNNIIIDDVVLMKDLTTNKISVIHGCKSFSKPLGVNEKLSVGLMNGKNLSYIVDSCLLSDTDSLVNGSAKLSGKVTMKNTMRSLSFKVDGTKLGFLNEANETVLDFIDNILLAKDNS